ncbi:MAG: hypothetical protein GC160_24755 [Acidobacteria bacterium]|nr:hypothetical protein [Acidobacteriota bacterium]
MPKSVLVVSQSGVHPLSLSVALKSTVANVIWASSIAQASRILRRDRSIAHVATQAALPDGTWSDLVDVILEEESAAAVHVWTPETNFAFRFEVARRGDTVLCSASPNQALVFE